MKLKSVTMSLFLKFRVYCCCDCCIIVIDAEQPLVQPVMPAVPTDAQHLPTMDTNDINFDMDEILRGITIDDNLLNTDITDPSMPLNEPQYVMPAPQPYQTDSSVYYPNNN